MPLTVRQAPAGRLRVCMHGFKQVFPKTTIFAVYQYPGTRQMHGITILKLTYLQMVHHGLKYMQVLAAVQAQIRTALLQQLPSTSK